MEASETKDRTAWRAALMASVALTVEIKQKPGAAAITYQQIK